MLLELALDRAPVFALASRLVAERIPVLFGSALGRDALPGSLAGLPLVTKPYGDGRLVTEIALLIADAKAART